MNSTTNYNPTQNKSIPLADLIVPTKGLKGRVIVIRNSRGLDFGAHKLFTGLDCLSYAHVFRSFPPDRFLESYFRMQMKPSDGLYLKVQSDELLPDVKQFIQRVSEWAVEKNMWAVVQLNMPLADDTYDHALYADIAIDLDPEVELNGILLKNRLAYGEELPCPKTNTGK